MDVVKPHDSSVGLPKSSEERQFPQEPSVYLHNAESLILSGKTEEAWKALVTYYRYLRNMIHESVNWQADILGKVPGLSSPIGEELSASQQKILEHMYEYLHMLQHETRHLCLHLAELFDAINQKEEAAKALCMMFLRHYDDQTLERKSTHRLAKFLSASPNKGFYLETLHKFVESTFHQPGVAAQKLTEIETVMTANSVIREEAAKIESILAARPLNIQNVRQCFEKLRGEMVRLTSLGYADQIDVSTLDQKCRRPIQLARRGMHKETSEAQELTRLLLLLIEGFIECSSAKKEKLFMNLADFYETLHASSKGLWDEFGGENRVKDCLSQLRNLGEEIRSDTRLWLSYFENNLDRKSRFLSSLAEAYRASVEHEIGAPQEYEGYLFRALEYFKEALYRKGHPVEKYFNYQFPRIAWCCLKLAEFYSEREQNEEAITFYLEAVTYYLETVNPNLIRKETAWESRCGMGDSLLSLGLLAYYDKEYYEAEAYYSLAEIWYHSVHYLKHAATVPVWETTDAPLLGKMADFYYKTGQYEKALPFYKTIMQNEGSSPTSGKYFYDCYSYRWAECLAKLHRNPEAIAQFKATLARNPEREHRIKPYIWMMRLCIYENDYKGLEEVKDQLLKDDLVERELEGISLDHLDVLLDPDIMEQYVEEVEELLDRGDYHKVNYELRNLIKENLAVNGKDDKLLLTLIARANIGLGNYDLALKRLNYAIRLDPRPKNMAIALHYIGRVYMRLGLYGIAAQAFQESFEVGNDIAMLSLSASAFRKMEEYDRAIELYQRIRGSGLDNRPDLTAMGVAESFWAQYMATKNEIHASDALNEISSVITGEVWNDPSERQIGDWRACSMLAQWSYYSGALIKVTEMLREDNPQIAANILSALGTLNKFHDDFLIACLDRLTENPSPDYLLKVSADYLMKATIFSYFFEVRAVYLSRLEYILSCILGLVAVSPREFMCEYLCASKGAYIEYLDGFASRKIKECLPPENLGQEQVEFLLRDKTAPAILGFLRDSLSLIPPLPSSGAEFLPREDWLSEICPIRSNDGLRSPLNPELDEEHFVFVAPDVIPRTPGWFAWQSALETIGWFFPNNSDLSPIWHKVLGSCQWSAKVVVTARYEAIQLHIEAIFDPSALSEKERDTRFRQVREGLLICPVPWFCGFSAVFNCDEIEFGRMRAVLSIPTVLGNDAPEAPLLPFFRFMIESFWQGLKGRFDRSGYRPHARASFPEWSLNWMGLEQWSRCIDTYLHNHVALAILETLASKHFLRVLHDASRPFREIGAGNLASRPELVQHCLEKLDELEYEIHHVRRIQLSTLTGTETRRWIDLKFLLAEIIIEEEKTRPDIRWTFESSGNLALLQCEPALTRRALACLLHNAAQACASLPPESLDRNPVVSLVQSSDSIEVTIINPYALTPTYTWPNTGYGLRDAEWIIEDLHGGNLVGPDRNVPREGYCRVVVSMPLTIRDPEWTKLEDES